MIRSSSRIAVLGLLLFLSADAAAEYRQDIVLQEHLGFSWPRSLVRRTIQVDRPGQLFPGQVALLVDNARATAQLDQVTKHPDGSIRKADLWFFTDLPAGGKRTVTITSVAPGPASIPASDLAVARQANVLEFRNRLTGVRFPAGTWQSPQGADPPKAAAALSGHLGLVGAGERLPGPILGCRLADGIWTAMSLVACEKPLLSYTTEVLAEGPVFASAKISYRFAEGATYDVRLRLLAEDPVVHVDETYRGAGSLSLEFRQGATPSRIVYEAFRASPKGKETAAAELVGWNDVFQDRGPALGLMDDPGGLMLAFVSIDSDWLPYPYRQPLRIKVRPGATPVVEGPLESGQRHWGLMSCWQKDLATLTASKRPQTQQDRRGSPDPAETADRRVSPTVGRPSVAGVARSEDRPQQPEVPVKLLYDWWWSRFMVTLDKVLNWDLVWPGMENIPFPHTFFGPDDLPGIRARLRNEPVVVEVMKRCKDPAAWYLYSDNKECLERIKGEYTQGTGYLDSVVERNIVHCGYFFHDRLRYLNVTDELNLRLLEMEFLLGSDLLTPPQRKKVLSQLSFVAHLMHDPMWIPPCHPVGTVGYGQGSPNMQHCLWSFRGMLACFLGNHPRKQAWIDLALEETERCLPQSINHNGVHLESPFYSARDTMRFVPFWTAMQRAGVSGPIAEKWIQREKMTFQYLGDMLTPPEPRMGGRRVYHPLGRSSPGVIDPTFMIGAYPWGLTDPHHGRLMRWLWQSQGSPSPDIMGQTGGRPLAQTLMAFSHTFEPLAECPLASRRWEGMGVVLRSQAGTPYESNVVFRHDPFCWDLYPANNGGVYFYGKGAPLSVRFGGYWMHQAGQYGLMDIPFGNRLLFAEGENQCLGRTTHHAFLGNLADFARGEDLAGDWRRAVLLAKDLDREDPIYLLVRDDVSRRNSPTAVHWWVMSKDVQPQGIEQPGMVPTKGRDEVWLARLGKNWPGAPRLTGQLQRFRGQCGVDLDLFIALPSDPRIVTDAIGVGPRLSYCVNPKLYEYQQLVRIEQPAGQSYLTLLAPRWPDGPKPEYRTIGQGAGVAVRTGARQDWLFLAKEKAVFTEGPLTFSGRAGYLRSGPGDVLRMMVADGSISAQGITLTASQPAALIYDGQKFMVHGVAGEAAPKVDLSERWKGKKIEFR